MRNEVRPIIAFTTFRSTFCFHTDPRQFFLQSISNGKSTIGQYDYDQNDVILGYYCTSQNGARTLGTCAHVASILWYLGYARHIP